MIKKKTLQSQAQEKVLLSKCVLHLPRSLLFTIILNVEPIQLKLNRKYKLLFTDGMTLRKKKKQKTESFQKVQ